MSAEKPRDFWSRRKAGVAAEAAVEVEVVEAVDPDLSDEEILEKFGLPDPHSISLGDDVKGFMAKAVPEHLRKIALRQLWRSNPTLACLDGLVDYADDYTDSATVFEGMKTAYQVGKGMTAHVEEMARKAEALLRDDDVAPSTDAQADTKVEVCEPDEARDPEQAQTPDHTVQTDEEMPAPRRRMKFDYADQAPELGTS